MKPIIMKLEREQIQTLRRRLNDVYDGYRKIVKILNEVVRSSGFYSKTYTIEFSEKQKFPVLMLNELSKIEGAVQELKNLLENLEQKM